MKTLTDIEQGLQNGDIVEQLGDQGLPEYVLKTEGNLNEYAVLIKTWLEQKALVAHDFKTKIWDANRTRYAVIDYKSGWPLDGLADGEVE